MIDIRHSFSRKLSFGILLLAIPIFIISLGVLFTQSRHMIRVGAVQRASSVLNATMQQLRRHLMTIENATNANVWQVERVFNPDSLLTYSRRIVMMNPHMDGCSVSAEPNVFPQYGRYFSVYTIREGDSIETAIEREYEYFERIWYKKAHDQNAPCWVVFYDDTDTLDLVLDGLLASYCKPIYKADSTMVGIMSSDLSLTRLSKVMSQMKPYPNSYFMMLNEEGYYYIHPDSTRLFTHTIFSEVDPRRRPDIIALGHEMTAGNKGSMAITIDGVPSLVCYQPVPSTPWSLAIVCPDNDVLAGYYKLTYIVLPLLIIGMIVIIWLCSRTVSHTIRPLSELYEKTQSIADGNMEVYIPRSDRKDVIGRLQNSFSSMLTSLNFHMGSVRYSSDQAIARNEELVKATELVREAEKQKTAFIQNVSHQIRTPLNVIMGFSQILSETGAFSDSGSGHESEMSEAELKNITDTMGHNSQLLIRLVLMLYDSSETGLLEELNAHKHDKVLCNDVVREAMSYIQTHHPDMPIDFESNVPDDFEIETSRLYLMRSLREMLYNAAKYSDKQNVKIRVHRTETSVQFIIQDTGVGIKAADREVIFQFFMKADDLSEGLGLGLPLSKRHAHNLGGDLWIDTDYKEGCRIILELPLTSM